VLASLGPDQVVGRAFATDLGAVPVSTVPVAVMAALGAGVVGDRVPRPAARWATMVRVPSVRAMESDDVAACESLWHDAFHAMRVAYHLPVAAIGDAEHEQARRHMALVRDTDPGGSWVALQRDEIVGFTQALRRDDLWVLSLLAVALAHQGRGVARTLLDRALSYGDPSSPGMIMSSRHPAALHRYVQAGFALHPTVAARGVVRRSGLEAGTTVQVGGPGDLETVAHVDRRLRGASHGPEMRLMLDEGAQLLVVPGRGYALARPGGVRVMGAVDDETAGALLAAALAVSPEGTVVDVNWITGAQQWAIRVCSDLGLELHPVGAVMVRGRPGPLAPYLPSGAYG